MSDVTVDLTNCDAEPIHAPGSIQPFGFLFVCDRDGKVLACSDNTGVFDGIGEPSSIIGRDLREVLPEMGQDVANWGDESVEIERGDRLFHATTSETADALLVEVEPEASGTSRAALDRQIRQIGTLQRSRGVLSTLQLAARSVREVVGHDRVMVYRFRPDLSGEVVVDEHAADLPSFLAQRYPASDIPAQARRLYVENPTRMIVDVNAVPSAIVPAGFRGLDLGPAALRSVSPIHLEYLRNMGVASSFSVSIVIRGELWGLIAGHHREPRYLSRNQRAYCELLAQHISLVVDAEDRKEMAVSLERAAEGHHRIIDRATAGDDLVQALAAVADELQALIPAQGVAILLDWRVVTAGVTPARPSIEALAAQLNESGSSLVSTAAAPAFFPGVDLGTSAGVLAANFNPSNSGWILWFRPEVVHTVTWGGDPRKNVTHGPLGARLTPRGSFDAYIETVRGTSELWSSTDLAITGRLRESLQNLALRKSVETARLRDMVLSTLGHDLRSPLTAIQMAAQLMDGGDGELTASITASSRRMRRLLDNLMEYSREQSGAIVLQRERADLGAIANRLADEARMAFLAAVNVEVEGDVMASVDVVRIEQLLANLLSNARHHGDPTSPVTVRVWSDADAAFLSVHNDGPEIPESMRATLFEAFTSSRAGTSRGLGLGLYIVSRVVTAHGGSIDVQSAKEAGTTFEIRLPRN